MFHGIIFLEYAKEGLKIERKSDILQLFYKKYCSSDDEYAGQMSEFLWLIKPTGSHIDVSFISQFTWSEQD